MPETPRFKRFQTPKAPPISATERDAIAEFLNFMADRTEIQINDGRVLMMTDKSRRLVRWVSSLRERMNIIRFLQSINDQRKVANGTEAAGP